MVPAGNKAKCLLSVNHTTITIHHHHHINMIVNTHNIDTFSFHFSHDVLDDFALLLLCIGHHSEAGI